MKNQPSFERFYHFTLIKATKNMKILMTSKMRSKCKKYKTTTYTLLTCYLLFSCGNNSFETRVM